MWGHGYSLIAFVCSLLCLLNVSISAAGSHEILWENSGRGITDTDLRVVAVDPDDPDTVYAGGMSTVYKSVDGGREWKEILSFRGTDNSVNTIAISQGRPVLYAGTQSGLYRSIDAGSNWKKVYSGMGDKEGSVLSMAVHPDNPEVVYIGTGKGIYIKRGNGNQWEKMSGIPLDTAVSSIAIVRSSPNIIYASTEGGIYKSMNSGAGWKKVCGSESLRYDDEVFFEGEVEDGTFGINSKIRTVSVDPDDIQKVYAGTSDGLLVSENGGATWTKADGPGLFSRDIRHIVIDPSDKDSVYAATGRGVFRYSRGTARWEDLYRGLASEDIRHLAISGESALSGHVWAASRRGVFRTVTHTQNALPEVSGQEPEDVMSIFAWEPTIEEIRYAAIEYAEVRPDKIEKWRNAAANKAWLPDVRFEYGKDRDWQTSTYFYSTSSQKYKDDDVTAGRDNGWSISLTWELGELIWNSDQTSIDNRSKLMVQLRDDILNEVTRLYFERRRLQTEMFLAPPANIQEKIDRELRLQELTASIDALTGSYLSKRLKTGGGIK